MIWLTNFSNHLCLPKFILTFYLCSKVDGWILLGKIHFQRGNLQKQILRKFNIFISTCISLYLTPIHEKKYNFETYFSTI